MTEPPEAAHGRRGRDPGYTSRATRWAEFKQRVRAHAPSELLPAVAEASARLFDGGPLKVDRRGMHPWALAEIARESLAYGNEHRRAPVTPQALRDLHNRYNDLADPFLAEADGPFDVMLRIVYSQADWQSASFPEMARLGAMFNRPFDTTYEVLTPATVIEMLGTDPNTYFGAALIFTVSAQMNAGRLNLGWFSQPNFAPVIAEIPEDVLLDVFHRVFGADYAAAAERCRSTRNPEPELRKYDLNPLVVTPYVRMPDGTYVAPATKLVADKASLASVYHLGQKLWQDRFTRDLGRLVETYVGDQLALIPGAAVTPERRYGRNGASKTVDWIVVLPTVVVLVEVKSARVSQAGRLDVEGFFDDVKKDVGKGLGQIATTAQMVASGHTVLADIPTDRPVRGMVVTAEPHHLINSPIYREGLPDPTVPTPILSLEELENTVTLTLATDPSGVLLDLTDRESDAGYDVVRKIARLHRDAGLAEWNNPILDAAYAQYPFHPDDSGG